MAEAHSSRGAQFTTQFWKSFKKGLGSKVKFCTAFHSMTDGYHSYIQMSPFETFYGRRCRSPIGWFEVCEVELMFNKPWRK
ncbi:hypothetical protein MTR67_044208 [Solanum verrucosum]|uniref:Uncharacterized protein n=1 Tax=Solanum verrucosum TaxID=315347 RepID=A0AAF0ZV28_SOLVR|nr:hypothetical protein MTR67_044208 [Solanum verrucosum]